MSPDRGLGHISPEAEGTDVISVEAVSLDDYCSRNAPPQFIKCDVEGAEVKVFRGARRLLTEHRPGFLCELHSDELRRTLLQEFASQGYRYHDCDSTHILALPR
jgi:Methyltransferase FkbM domain